MPSSKLALATSLFALTCALGTEAMAAPKRGGEEGVIREIERGPYVQANIGSTFYLGARRFLRPGTTVDLTVGGDVVDKDKLSVAVQFTLSQAMHLSALNYEGQPANGVGLNGLIQGNTYTLGAYLGAKASAYPIRRLAVGGHLGAGVMAVPLLMDRASYDEVVVGLGNGDGAWGGPANAPAVHRGVKPTLFAGPHIEYYTKLSHFSLGVDVDFIYAIGMDFGGKATGFFKYTF
jgi:hypothetical protein